MASRRHTDGPSAIKRDKDARQAALLFEALQQTRRAADLTLVYNEAWDRGAQWQNGIRIGAGMLTEDERGRLRDCLRAGAMEIGEDLTMPF